MRTKALVVLALAALLAPLGALPARSAVLCFGLAPTIVVAQPYRTTNGTEGNDVILGTYEHDEIRGRGGNDYICGGGGSDSLYGGEGRDRISGGGDHDHLYGGPGRDRLLGGGGDDYLRGDDGPDRVYGGDGDDALYGDAGDGNALAGNAGADYLNIEGEGDRALGGAGNDHIYGGGADNSILQGGPGDDEIWADIGSDLDGGSGIDHCAFDVGVTRTGCESLELDCWPASHEPPAPGSTGLTTAPGDFDGNGEEDTLYVWLDPVHGWMIHVQADDGYWGSRQELDADPAELAAAIGGYDIDGDGIDEIFAQAGSYPRPVVAIFTLHTGATGDACDLEPVQFGEIGPVGFEIGAATDIGDLDNGLACLAAEHRLRQYVQQVWSPTEYLQHRYRYDYLAHLGEDVDPELVGFADFHGLYTTPADDEIIALAREFHCGSLALP